jgi:16S rRNA (cytidine1402-2'-O)-methyltransferase
MTDDDPMPPAPAPPPGPPTAAGPRLAPGLHLVATPIGAARDITLHALDLLAGADLLAAEDTRTLRHLMEIHGVPLRGRMVVTHHDHAGPGASDRILTVLRAGGVVAYASDAGTPLVSDPGFDLVRLALAEGLPVHAAPGPSALLAALTVAGLPTDRFFFAGFLPAKAGARRTALMDLAAMPATVVLYESPHRIHACLDDLAASFGPDRRAALCRELTKRHEEVLRGSLSDLVAEISGRDLKGEIVLVLDRASQIAASAEDLDTALRDALQGASVKEAAAQVAERLGLPRRQVYQRALDLQR